MSRHTLRLIPTLAVVASACAHTPQRPSDARAGGPYAQAVAGDAAACRPDGFLVVHNAESFPVVLVGLPATAGPWGDIGTLSTQPLGPLAGGKADTIADLNSSLRYVAVRRDEAHAVYVEGKPPLKVSFTCTGVTRGGSARGQ